MYVVDSPYELANWRPLVNWIMYIPHAIILSGLRGLAGAVGFIYWLMLIFTGQLNRSLYGSETLLGLVDGRELWRKVFEDLAITGQTRLANFCRATPRATCSPLR